MKENAKSREIKGGGAMIIRPQPKQEEFLSNPADLVIY